MGKAHAHHGEAGAQQPPRGARARRQAGHARRPRPSLRYPTGGYSDLTGEYRAANLQGCPRELRLLLGHDFLHDLDFKNSLPTAVARSQLDMQRLCSLKPAPRRAECIYCNNRSHWFKEIVRHHNIPAVIGLDTPADDVAKALNLRLLHGGSCKALAEEFGVDGNGASRGRRALDRRGPPLECNPPMIMYM